MAAEVKAVLPPALLDEGPVESGEPFETGPADNLQTLRLVEDAYRLAERG